ncbi:hypothetical protein SDC9_207973 [bioreactor metagenome]|uniref:Uncharacterized protein n=1 Tax=bioreactor metagenome TaxID=1076179 RepID=A0A645JA26_9ZZZZ
MHSGKISVISKYKLASSLSSMVVIRTPSFLSSFLAKRKRKSIKEIHLLCRYSSCLSTKSLLYFQSFAPVLYGGSMYMQSILLRCVFSKRYKACRLSPSIKKFHGIDASLQSLLSLSSHKTGMFNLSISSTSSVCSSKTRPNFLSVS